MFAGPLEGSPTFYGAQTVSIAHNSDGAEARARHPGDVAIALGPYYPSNTE